MAGLLNLLVLIVLSGFVLWIFYYLLRVPAKIQMAINAVVVLIILAYVLQFFGVGVSGLPTINMFH
ncbi:MAG: hypothetical protein WC627_04570 [Legionella sp.]|jgi:hypothetical protein